MGNDIQQIDKNFAVEAAVRCDGMSFYDVKNSPFSVYGLYDYKNQMPYKRMPDEIGKNVNEGVARLYTNTSGGRIRFSTDSDLIILKAELLSVGRMPHFPITGTCGFDIYEDFPELDSSRYLATFIPPYDVTDIFESKVTLSGRKKRYFTIHFPLYSSVSDVLIGVRDDATLEQGREYKNILPHWQEDLDRAIKACLTTPLLFRDHLCCGNSSAVDFLLEAGAVLNREDLTQAGRMVLSRMAKRRERDYVYLPQTYKPAFTPTLFYGAAGVGYVLLRAIRQELPSVFI